MDRPTISEAPELPADLTSTSQEPFVWTKQWYPGVPSDHHRFTSDWLPVTSSGDTAFCYVPLLMLSASEIASAVSIMEALSTKKPNAIHLLGKELVIWRDDEGQWVCMDDQCSHRLAPLSGAKI